MKILILNNGRKFTGEGAHCLDLAEQLILQGHDAKLALHGDCIVHERATERGLPIAIDFYFSRGLAARISDLRKLRKFIRETEPDVVHCHRGNDHGLAVAATFGMSADRRPAIIRTRHRVVPVVNTLPNRWLFTKRTDGVLAVSQKAADSFGEMTRLIRDKLDVIYSSVDREKFHPSNRWEEWRAGHGVKPEQPLVGLIARFQRVKGQEIFLRAAALVAREFPDAYFLLAGRGSAHKIDRAKELAAELGIGDRTVFEEWIPEVHRVTASLDVGVLASLGSEGSSRVTYEYMAAEVPVVATSVGCIPEVVDHGRTGLVVPPGDVEALADAIKEVLRSADMRRKFTGNARQQIDNQHTRERWIEAITTAYKKAIARK